MAVMEPSAMTLKEAEQVIEHWQNELTNATAAVAAYETQVGDLALVGKAADASRELARLRDQTIIAEQALQAAQRQRVAVQRRELRERVDQHRAELAEINAQLEEKSRILTEANNAAQAAHEQFSDLARRSMSLERFIESASARMAEGQ